MKSNYYKKYEPIFGSWFITEEIGQGAYGKVYIIERHEMGVVYKSALKAMTIPSSRNEVTSIMSDGMTYAEATEYYKGLVQNIVNEFIVMSKLKGHSNIVSYEDHVLIEHEDDIGWDILIRMELLTPLIDHTSEHNMDEKEVIKLGIDICKALEFCRKYDIIHRDIKPENIFIAPSGDYKLGDFGIAKTVEKAQIGLSRKGTYIYMAPEVYAGDAYGETVDIYSLGVVMYKLLNNNRAPFMPAFPKPMTYDDREEAFSRRVNGEKIPLPENGSEELKNAVMKACSFDVEERYASAFEMRKALERIYFEKNQDESTGQKEADPSSKNKFKGKKKYLLGIIPLILLLVWAFFIPKSPEDITGIADVETVYIGDTLSPQYRIEPKRFKDEILSFGNYNNSIIAVDNDGEIKGIQVGETDLTVSAAGYSEKITVKVIAKVEEILNIEDTVTLTEGESYQFEPELRPEKFKNEKIFYKIGDENIAAISDSGKLNALEAGTTELEIEAGGYLQTVNIVVNEYVPPVVVTRNYTSNSSNDSTKDSKNSNTQNSKSESKIKPTERSDYFLESDDEYF